MSRRIHALAFAVALLDGTSCKVERRSRPDSALASATDTLRAIASGDIAVDSAAAPHAPPARADTAPIIASIDELDDLAAHLTIPVEGVVAGDLVDTYAERRGSGTRPHEALDIPAPMGTPVRSATAGRVLRLYESKAGGLMVYAADASDRFILMYAHLSRFAGGLADGQPLARGQIIGYVGTTGNAPPGTPHLHFAIARGRPSLAWWRGTPVNPYPLLTGG